MVGPWVPPVLKEDEFALDSVPGGTEEEYCAILAIIDPYAS